MNKNKWRPWFFIENRTRWQEPKHFTIVELELSFTGHVYLMLLTLFNIRIIFGFTSRGLKPYKGRAW